MSGMKLMTGSVRNPDNPNEAVGFTKTEVNKINYFVKDMLNNEYSSLKKFSYVDKDANKSISEDLKNNLYVVVLNPISFKKDKVLKVDATKFAKELEDRIRKSNVSDARVQSFLQGDTWNIRVAYKKMKKFIRKQEFYANVSYAKDAIKEKLSKNKEE